MFEDIYSKRELDRQRREKEFFQMSKYQRKLIVKYEALQVDEESSVYMQWAVDTYDYFLDKWKDYDKN